MNYFQRKRLKKTVHHLLHEARHARHMREDVVEPALIEELNRRADKLAAAWEARDEQGVHAAAESLSAMVHKVYPAHRSPRVRENIEILVVAVSVAMAFRTFFIQPFRIPTGSMQPTLYGITYTPQDKPGLMDRIPLKLIPFLLFGESYAEVRAEATGLVEFNQEYTQDAYVIRVAGVPHMVHRDLQRYFEPGRTQVNKGDLLASGRKKLGDHIFVNRIWYNFFPPQRGDVFVFSTRDIQHPDIRPDNYYIKRLVGLPEERISIDPPYLMADGERVTEPRAFVRQVEGEGYHGYITVGSSPAPALLRDSGDVITIEPGHYLPFGDNTRASLDGRFFGAVDQRNIIGPAFMIYWPFTERWGLVD